jgi:PII-like signaling protein
MNALKLTTYFSERDRAGERFLADALFDLYERHRLRTSVLLRGIAGFGPRHQLQSDRLLTLSESLPAVSVAVDTRERIEEMLPDVLELASHGLVSVEPAALVSSGEQPPVSDQVQATIYGGRAIRSGGQAGYVALIDRLRDAGVATASVLLGVDGTLHGERRRARFFARNAGVPLMVLTIGDPERIGTVLPDLPTLLEDPVVTVERLPGDPGTSHRKVIAHLGEQSKVNGRPVYVELVRRLAQAGAAGATVIRGVRGVHAGGPPIADRFFSLRRNVPVHVIAIDTADAVNRWWPAIAELTDSVTISSGTAHAHRRASAAPPPGRPSP